MDFCQVFCFFTFCNLISLICFGDERTLDEGRGLDSGFYYTFCFFWGEWMSGRRMRGRGPGFRLLFQNVKNP